MERVLGEPVTEPAPDPAVVLQDGGIRLRRLRDSADEYALLARWLNEPHVRYWWDPDNPPATAATVAEQYGPFTRAGDPTTACIIEVGDEPVGYIQFYPWSADAEYARTVGVEYAEGDWGLDVFIGAPDRVERGLGTQVVDLLCTHLGREFDATSVMLVTDTANARAQRAYEKAGFSRIAEIIDTDTRNGERVRSYLMRRRLT